MIRGNAFVSRGKVYARTPVGGGKRHCSPVPWAASVDDARERATVLADVATRLRGTGDPSIVELLPKLLDRAAAADAKGLRTILETVDRLVSGKIAPVKVSRELVPLRKPRTRGVYFVAAGDRVKIGKADNIHRRIGNLQTANPIELKLVAFIETPTPSEEEAIQHRRFWSFRTIGEWFELRGDLFEFLLATNLNLRGQA